jgi:macrolide transport system ATP-binding/permease protein
MALIELKNLDKTYHLGEVDLPVLKNVSLTIEHGEFVALMGASGSGKTTLMNLLGCLDRPSAGSFKFDGIEVAELSRPQLAVLRSSRIGFVFQSFNLLPRTTAEDNVRMPSAYSAERISMRQFHQRSQDLLDMVGLKERMDHAPAQLSGGEQQRVAIARSLVNAPMLLLADEPTGNLDSRTGKEILQLFRQLNTEKNITLLLVTHDPEVARHADRVIRISDGQIVDDKTIERDAAVSPKPAAAPAPETTAVSAKEAKRKLRSRGHRGNVRIMAGAARIALQALRRNVMRTVLTMLGVIIGVSAVIAIMEISQGASKAIQITVSNMGANMLSVAPGVTRRGAIRVSSGAATLTPDDAIAITRECPSAVCAAPVVGARAPVVYGNRNWTPHYMIGTTPSFLRVRNWEEIELGRVFNEREVLSGAKVCLIGQTVVDELFGDRYPVGEEIRVKNVPFTVIGVLEAKGANLLGVDQDDILIAPWSTVKYRIHGGGSAAIPRRRGYRRGDLPGKALVEHLPGSGQRVRSEAVQQILVKAESTDAIPDAIEEITLMLRDRHRLGEDVDDFRVRDMEEVSDAMRKVVSLLSGLGLSIAAVSLIVGGVGIMNIMLVSVTERTREIGLRMAVGANGTDILRQFLVEAVVLCLVGGLIGIIAGRGASLLVGMIMNWPTAPSASAAVVAVAVSVTVGVTFGYYPAWKASRLNPIDALRYE